MPGERVSNAPKGSQQWADDVNGVPHFEQQLSTQGPAPMQYSNTGGHVQTTAEQGQKTETYGKQGEIKPQETAEPVMWDKHGPVKN